MIYLVEMTVATDAAGTTTVLRATTAAFYATQPADTPANTLYLPRAQAAGLFRRDIASPGRIYGANSVGFGYVDLVNADGALDGWLAYSFAGRTCQILMGEEGAAYSTFTVLLKGTMDKIEFPSNNILRVRIRDRLQELSKPLQTTEYAGTNSLPSGLEGVDELRGKNKPRVYGRLWNICPPCVNTSRLIYQVSDQALYAVYSVSDKGVVLTAGSVYASQSDMETNAPTAGQYRAWLSGGMFRLGSTPSGRVTAHVGEFDITTGSSGCPGSLIRDVALDAGIASGDISAADVTALNSACAHNDSGFLCGVDEQTTAIDVMDYFASSAGAWYGFDRLGVLHMAQLVAPSAGSSVYTFQTYEIFDLALRASEDAGAGVPVWSVTAQYCKNWCPMNDGELAGGVTMADRPRYIDLWRKTTYSDASIKTKHLQAKELTVDLATCLVANAAAEAQRREELLEVERNIYNLRVRVSAAMMGTIDLGKVVQVNVSRYGMSGKAFLIVGVLHDPLRQSAELTLWG